MNRYTIEINLGDINSKVSFVGKKEVCDKTGYSHDTLNRWFTKNPTDQYMINGFTKIKRERKVLKR